MYGIYVHNFRCISYIVLSNVLIQLIEGGGQHAVSWWAIKCSLCWYLITHNDWWFSQVVIVQFTVIPVIVRFCCLDCDRIR